MTIHFKRSSKSKENVNTPNPLYEDTICFIGSGKFRIEAFIPILDGLSAELTKRWSAYQTPGNVFGFLTELNGSDGEEECDIKLAEKYAADLERSFPNEFRQFCGFVKKEITVHPKPNVLYTEAGTAQIRRVSAATLGQVIWRTNTVSVS